MAPRLHTRPFRESLVECRNLARTGSRSEHLPPPAHGRQPSTPSVHPHQKQTSRAKRRTSTTLIFSCSSPRISAIWYLDCKRKTTRCLLTELMRSAAAGKRNFRAEADVPAPHGSQLMARGSSLDKKNAGLKAVTLIAALNPVSQ